MAHPLDPEHPGRFSSSLVAGLSMLSCFTAEYPVRGIADVAEALDLGRSSWVGGEAPVSLATGGFLAAARRTGLAGSLASGSPQDVRCPLLGVRLPPATDPQASDVELSLLDSMAIRSVAREPLRELRARTGRTVSLGVLWGTEVAYIDRWQGSRQGQYTVDGGIGVGTRLPVQRELITKLRLTRRAPKTVMAKTALRAELERIAAEDGIAIEDEECSAGRRAIAAVMVDAEGRSIAAVELAVPVDVYSRKKLLTELGPEVVAVARDIGLDQAGAT
jgi:DNA-binding IclR family transcriptional regulator